MRKQTVDLPERGIRRTICLEHVQTQPDTTVQGLEAGPCCHGTKSEGMGTHVTAGSQVRGVN